MCTDNLQIMDDDEMPHLNKTSSIVVDAQFVKNKGTKDAAL